MSIPIVQVNLAEIRYSGDAGNGMRSNSGLDEKMSTPIAHMSLAERRSRWLKEMSAKE